MGYERRHAKPSVARNFAVVQQSLESDAEKADLAEAETSLAAVVIAHCRLRPSRRLELLRFRRCSFIGRGTVGVPVGVQRQVLVIRRGPTGPALE